MTVTVRLRAAGAATAALAAVGLVAYGCSSPEQDYAQVSNVVVEDVVIEELVVAEMLPDALPATVPDAAGDRYEEVVINPVVVVAEQPVSTFSIDVDTASYANVRRYLEEGSLPPPGAVRVEEMINYFEYAYAAPADAEVPFATSVTVMPTPWNPGTRLLHVAIKGYDLADEERPRANLVFLVDVSGSMQGADRLGLVVAGLRQLVGELRPDDSVAIVTYAGSVGVALEPTPGARRAEILAALDGLAAYGSTAGAAGIALAYDAARAAFLEDGVNRVILATDGDFNVGLSDPDALEAMIAREREDGIYLSVLGVGRGNLNDALMQRLAQNGNGNAAYMDSLLEARKVLVEEIGGTLFPIADDVKIQVEFNPARVAEYRLLGYETRLLAREDFANDAVDAGEIGNGHAVTAIYEIVPVDSPFRWMAPLRYDAAAEAGAAEAGDAALSGELALLALRYKLPGEDESRLIERPVVDADLVASVAGAAPDVRFSVAVAAWGELLRGDPHMAGWDHDHVVALARDAMADDPWGYRAEFLRLADLSGALARAE